MASPAHTETPSSRSRWYPIVRPPMPAKPARYESALCGPDESMRVRCSGNCLSAKRASVGVVANRS